MTREYGPEDYSASYFCGSEVCRISNYDASYTHPGIVRSTASRLRALIIAFKFRSKLGLGRLEILDIGGATGIFASHLARIPGLEVCNVDLSTWATQHSVATMRGLTVQGSVAFLPFRDSSFHGIVSSNVLEHVAERSIIGVAKEVYRVLRPGGRGIVLVNTGDLDDFEADESHITRQRLRWWATKFRGQGFRVARGVRSRHLFAVAHKAIPLYCGLLIIDKPE